jgi:hypothetical protein
MEDIFRLIEGFDFEADPGEAVLDLFLRVIVCQASVASLKEISFKYLSEVTMKPVEEIDQEYQSVFDELKHELIAKFVSQYGKLSN